jgi:hypothetical protein
MADGRTGNVDVHYPLAVSILPDAPQEDVALQKDFALRALWMMVPVQEILSQPSPVGATAREKVAVYSMLDIWREF